MPDDSHQLELDGQTVTIRSISRADAELERDFVRRLSPESKRCRFLGAPRDLSPEELRRFCEIDGHRSMAFVATIDEGGETRMIGVSRYAPNSEGSDREIAITVADDWQKRGLGSCLAKKLIRHARQHGVEKLYSIDLADNTHMSSLARDLGMEAAPDPQVAYLVVYSLKLADAPEVPGQERGHLQHPGRRRNSGGSPSVKAPQYPRNR